MHDERRALSSHQAKSIQTDEYLAIAVVHGARDYETYANMIVTQHDRRQHGDTSFERQPSSMKFVSGSFPSLVQPIPFDASSDPANVEWNTSKSLKLGMHG
jgi:hypothetical protein